MNEFSIIFIIIITALAYGFRSFFLNRKRDEIRNLDIKHYEEKKAEEIQHEVKKIDESSIDDLVADHNNAIKSRDGKE